MHAETLQRCKRVVENYELCLGCLCSNDCSFNDLYLTGLCVKCARALKSYPRTWKFVDACANQITPVCEMMLSCTVGIYRSLFSLGLLLLATPWTVRGQQGIVVIPGHFFKPLENTSII